MSAPLLNSRALKRLVKEKGRVATATWLAKLDDEVRKVVEDHCNRKSGGRRLGPLLFELRTVKKGRKG